MKRFSLHFFVAILTFTVSVFGTSLYFYQSSKKEDIQKIETVVETKTEFRQSAKKVETVEETEPKSLSPYDLETYINNNSEANLGKIWQKLNISNQFNGLPNWEKNENFFESCASCEAETYEYDLDSEGGNEVILRIADTQELCRYLVFKKINFGENNWKLLGFIDHDFGRYQMPQHTFLLSGGKSFLVVKVQTQSGSGVAHYVDRLFIVQKNELIELMDFPSRGHLSMSFHLYFGDRNFTGRAADIRVQNNNAQVKVNFAVDYKFENGESDTKNLSWSKRQSAVFNISLKSGKKELDLSKSNISKKEIDSVYNFDVLNDNDFVKFNLAELKKLASKRKIKEKEFWCMFFCKP